MSIQKEPWHYDLCPNLWTFYNLSHKTFQFITIQYEPKFVCFEICVTLTLYGILKLPNEPRSTRTYFVFCCTQQKYQSPCNSLQLMIKKYKYCGPACCPRSHVSRAYGSPEQLLCQLRCLQASLLHLYISVKNLHVDLVYSSYQLVCR